MYLGLYKLSDPISTLSAGLSAHANQFRMAALGESRRSEGINDGSTNYEQNQRASGAVQVIPYKQMRSHFKVSEEMAELQKCSR